MLLFFINLNDKSTSKKGVFRKGQLKSQFCDFKGHLCEINKGQKTEDK